MTSDQLVNYEVIGPVAVLTMDDGRANALGPDLSAAINAALDRAEAEDIGAVVLAGREGRFSAGFDLGVIAAGDTEAILAMVAAGGALVCRLYGGPLPVVAACTGHAVAAGALMLLGCDVRVGPAVDNVKIGLNEVAIGLTLPRWALAIAAERLSMRHRQRSVVNSVLYDGPGGVEAGFLDRVVPSSDVVAEAVAEATVLAELDRTSYIKTVAAFRAATLAEMQPR